MSSIMATSASEEESNFVLIKLQFGPDKTSDSFMNSPVFAELKDLFSSVGYDNICTDTILITCPLSSANKVETTLSESGYFIAVERIYRSWNI